ncbi:hypothetical protein [Bacillus suaedaesalsae]|uniref:Uncharacterized protein n=1 Tax=Bacillus suaedaesalsae TaxID=2810349 RepID=A0ABS2DLP3_9BACI|nr:hypothetical protein [Bacillus suaedaesalsae]MBM6619399.1 hypothetical protein [Bacillus suaedaesalsae]
MEQIDDQLLQSFRELWHNRPLLVNGNAQETIRQAILTDIMDELTHPRARSTPHKKFYLAVKRILESSIPDNDKLAIIKLYEKELSKL